MGAGTIRPHPRCGADLPPATRNARLLLDQVKTALREIMRTVGGQFITCNEHNGQYYIDPDKDVDLAAKIELRAGFAQANKTRCRRTRSC